MSTHSDSTPTSTYSRFVVADFFANAAVPDIADVRATRFNDIEPFLDRHRGTMTNRDIHSVEDLIARAREMLARKLPTNNGEITRHIDEVVSLFVEAAAVVLLDAVDRVAQKTPPQPPTEATWEQALAGSPNMATVTIGAPRDRALSLLAPNERVSHLGDLGYPLDGVIEAVAASDGIVSYRVRWGDGHLGVYERSELVAKGDFCEKCDRDMASGAPHTAECSSALAQDAAECSTADPATQECCGAIRPLDGESRCNRTPHPELEAHMLLGESRPDGDSGATYRPAIYTWDIDGCETCESCGHGIDPATGMCLAPLSVAD